MIKILLSKKLGEMRLTQADLARATGISYGTMASMGKNEPVNLKQIDRICKALNCGISDVIEYIPD